MIAGRQGFCGVEVPVLDYEHLMANWQSHLRQSCGSQVGL
jgi:hypothetical protein